MATLSLERLKLGPPKPKSERPTHLHFWHYLNDKIIHYLNDKITNSHV